MRHLKNLLGTMIVCIGIVAGYAFMSWYNAYQAEAKFSELKQRIQQIEENCR